MIRAALARAARVASFASIAIVLTTTIATPRPVSHQRPRPRALPPEGPAPHFDLPLQHAPLDTPLVVTGGFGEYRIGHFHAGFDFSTGGETGKRVYAPLAGHIERIRTSGVGYGRSLYLRANDGRTIQFGHLDAFVEPIATWVRAIQDSTGQYEQDLWPEASRFPIKLGAQIAWTGQSGAGGPHMHFEIRRGDMAYQPMRAGLDARDDKAPTLVSLTLEPLDDTSYVERGAAPLTIPLGAAPETVTAIGRLRATIGARDGVWKGVDRMQPWLTRMDWGSEWIEARFDSISWASDMVESDYLYDSGRVVGEKGIVLWAPPSWRPRVMHASAKLEEAAGLIVMDSKTPPAGGARTLKLTARDAAGNGVEARVVLVMPAKSGPDTSGVTPAPRAGAGAPRFEIVSLPFPDIRLTVEGVPAGVRDVRIGFSPDASPQGFRPATLRGGRWSAVVPGATGALRAVGRTREGARWEQAGPTLVSRGGEGRYADSSSAGFGYVLPEGAAYDREFVFAEEGGSPPSPGSELVAISPAHHLLPETLPLRKPVAVTMSRLDLRERSHYGLFVSGGDDWGWVQATIDSARGVVRGETRQLGWFQVLADTSAPRIGAPVTAGARGGPYPRWAIEASITERGSGVDARASWIEFDGVRRPSEWDPEAGVLRWRPAARPPAGPHRVDVVATDKAGNLRRRSASLVLD
jgi:hypothetical protein